MTDMVELGYKVEELRPEPKETKGKGKGKDKK
jgi:hypothetical protein